MFRHEQIRLAVDNLLEGVARGAVSQRVVGLLLLEAVVADEHHRLPAFAPGPDQGADVALARRVVAPSPAGVIEGLLHVENKQGRTVHASGI